jgi:hypothetical protein
VSDDLEKLYELAIAVPNSPQLMEMQRRSFAYGNTHFENQQISREMIDREAEKLAEQAVKTDVK